MPQRTVFKTADTVLTLMRLHAFMLLPDATQIGRPLEYAFSHQIQVIAGLRAVQKLMLFFFFFFFFLNVFQDMRHFAQSILDSSHPFHVAFSPWQACVHDRSQKEMEHVSLQR